MFLALGREDSDRQTRYRELFRSGVDEMAIDDIRLALNQNQPLGDNRFTARIEQVTGERREARPRGRPRKQSEDTAGEDGRQSTFML